MKTSDIKLNWQRHNQKNGMSWNEMSEFANEIADHVLNECIPEPLSYDSIESTEYVEGFNHAIHIIKKQ